MSTVPRICIMTPGKKLNLRARRILREGYPDVGIYQVTMDDAADLGVSLMERGAEVLISRRVTKSILAEKLSIPVLDIPTALPDYFEFINKALVVDGFVAFFSANSIPEEVSTLCQLLNIDIRNYPFSNSAEAKKAVQRACAEGASLGVGYSYTNRVADQLNLRYVYLNSSEQSILESIEAAREILRAKDRERELARARQIEYEQLMAIFRATNEGLMSIDKNGSIKTINQTAESILNVTAREAVGHKVEEFIKDAPILRALSSGNAQTDRVFDVRGRKAVSTSIPVTVDDKVEGAVSVFKYVDVLQDSEHRVRAALYSKGLSAKYHFEDIVGSSPAIQNVIRLAKKYAASCSTVLISGETGVGKELFAQSIHNESPRRSAPFVAVNCAALDPNLLESELFGYVEGSFTGAIKGGKAGLFEAAHGGTIFLDEISAMPFNLQAKLLRVLQEREVRRIGSSKVVKIDVRIIAATNQDLAEAVENGSFRRDLFYRLNVLYLHIPPLRDREDDYLQIAMSIYSRISGPDSHRFAAYFQDALLRLREHTWPGNVRELSNLCERAALLNDINDSQTLELMLQHILTSSQRNAPPPIKPSDCEKEAILRALRQNGGIVSKTAEALGISRTTLWRKMKQLGIEPHS